MSRKWAFSNGTQYIDWTINECYDCKHYVADSVPDEGNGCPIEETIALATIVGNEVPVPDELEEQIGFYHAYKCTKRSVNCNDLGVD